jgi:hypothetical protein
MTDPSNALPLFQSALLAGQIPLRPGRIDQALFAAPDEVNGKFRMSYLRLQERVITALVQFVALDPIDGLPCFHIGYAVPEPYRRQGIARSAVLSAFSEMEHGYGRNWPQRFFVEAVVSPDNIGSKKVAEALFESAPEPITDSVSGKPALRYLRAAGAA